MSIDYRGESVRYDPRSNTYSRPPVLVFRVCKHGFKRPLRSDDEGCPCYRGMIDRKQETHS